MWAGLYWVAKVDGSRQHSMETVTIYLVNSISSLCLSKATLSFLDDLYGWLHANDIWFWFGLFMDIERQQGDPRDNM